MTDEEKKAIEICKKIDKDDLLNCWDYGEKEYNSIQTVLNLIEIQQKENAQLRAESNNKDKMIEMMAKELYHRVDNNVFGDSVEKIIDYFRKKVKDE